MVALEVLRDGEAEGGGRLVAGRVQHLDQQVDIAVRLRPAPLARHAAGSAGRRPGRQPGIARRMSGAPEQFAHRVGPCGRRRGRGGGTAPARCAPARSRRSPNGRPCRRRSGCPSSAPKWSWWLLKDRHAVGFSMLVTGISSSNFSVWSRWLVAIILPARPKKGSLATSTSQGSSSFSMIAWPRSIQLCWKATASAPASRCGRIRAGGRAACAPGRARARGGSSRRPARRAAPRPAPDPAGRPSDRADSRRPASWRPRSPSAWSSSPRPVPSVASSAAWSRSSPMKEWTQPASCGKVFM